MNAASLISLASGAGSVFGGIKMAAVLVTVLAGSGLLAYCQHQYTSGQVAKERIGRYADIAKNNADVAKRAGRDAASARKVERGWRDKVKTAYAARDAAIAARRAAEKPEEGVKVCEPGCVISR